VVFDFDHYAAALAGATIFFKVRTQRVQTRLSPNFCKFGFWRRSVLMLEWLRIAARFDPRPHESQSRAIVIRLK